MGQIWPNGYPCFFLTFLSWVFVYGLGMAIVVREMSWVCTKTITERAEAETAFWDRPGDRLWRDLVLPEEDLPPARRGGPRRWFKSANIVELVVERNQRGAK